VTVNVNAIREETSELKKKLLEVVFVMRVFVRRQGMGWRVWKSMEEKHGIR